MRPISSNLTEENFKKVHDHKSKLQKESMGTVTFTTALNDIIEEFEK